MALKTDLNKLHNQSQQPAEAGPLGATAPGAIDCSQIQPSLKHPATQAGQVSAQLENSKDPEKPKECLATRTLSSVKACEVKYLWGPYLPAGDLAMLSGDPATGKTWTALGVAADLTCGRTPFSNEPCTPTAVLYLTVDNSPEELRNRFTLLGGNLDLVHITDDPFWLSNITFLDSTLQKTEAKLMVVDPITSFLGPEVDTYRANKIRPIMDDLSRLAKKHGCCILLLRHLTKAGGQRAVHRGSGTIDFTAAVRSELLAGHAANDPKQRALVHTMLKLGPHGDSLGYAIGAKGFSWTGVSKLTEVDLLAPASHRSQGEAMTEAMDFLVTTLSPGPCMANQVFAEAKELHIKEITLKRAKDKLNIQSKKDGQSGPWLWSLSEGVQTPHTQKP